MSVETTDNAADQQFELRVDGALAALITYRLDGARLALTHTETTPGFERKGYARQLVEFALAHARAEDLAVLPHCEYVQGYIQRNPEQLDLVPQELRASFDLAPAGA